VKSLRSKKKVSDVAGVRPQSIEGHEDGSGLNGVLLIEIISTEDSPIQSVLQSLVSSLQGLKKPTTGAETTSTERDGVQVTSQPTTLFVPRDNKAVNEFEENDLLFLGAFPDLFLLGRKLPTRGSVPKAFTKHLLRQADNRFGQVDEIVFTLFNQSQRHAAARQIAARVQSDPDSILK